VFVLARFAGLISDASRMLRAYNDRAAALIDRAQAAVDRTHEQLARTDSITASMDDVTANMAELSGHVSDLAGLARGISAGLGTPLLRVSAFAFGVRRAVSLRRAPDAREALPPGRGALTARVRVRGALPRQRSAPGRAQREEARR
jgi:ABC-type transporter Mla subunit MlaD